MLPVLVHCVVVLFNHLINKKNHCTHTQIQERHVNACIKTGTVLQCKMELE